MNNHPFAGLSCLLSILLATADCVGDVQARQTSSARASTAAAGRPSLTIQSPAAGEIVKGVAIIRFQVENVSITSPFAATGTQRGALPAVHVHVTVDGTPWHWVHSSADPVVVTPLPAGEHTVALELAGADHRPLVARSVRFTVAARPAPAMDHSAHR
jgi:hypothetical protein